MTVLCSICFQIVSKPAYPPASAQDVKRSEYFGGRPPHIVNDRSLILIQKNGVIMGCEFLWRRSRQGGVRKLCSMCFQIARKTAVPPASAQDAKGSEIFLGWRRHKNVSDSHDHFTPSHS